MILKRLSFYTFATLCTAIGLYPVIYFIIDRKFGLLASKTNELLADVLWNSMFYTHITLGGIALLIGWTQFHKKWRTKNLKFHKKIGKIYIVTTLLSAITGFYIALQATGGLSPKLGFVGMALAWFFTTYFAFTTIKKGNVTMHQKLMIYSYAICFSAVTLRIWLPILTNFLGGFLPAYRIVAWLSWIPNILVAYFITKKTLTN